MALKTVKDIKSEPTAKPADKSSAGKYEQVAGRRAGERSERTPPEGRAGLEEDYLRATNKYEKAKTARDKAKEEHKEHKESLQTNKQHTYNYFTDTDDWEDNTDPLVKALVKKSKVTNTIYPNGKDKKDEKIKLINNAVTFEGAVAKLLKGVATGDIPKNDSRYKAVMSKIDLLKNKDVRSPVDQLLLDVFNNYAESSAISEKNKQVKEARREFSSISKEKKAYEKAHDRYLNKNAADAGRFTKVFALPGGGGNEYGITAAKEGASTKYIGKIETDANGDKVFNLYEADSSGISPEDAKKQYPKDEQGQWALMHSIRGNTDPISSVSGKKITNEKDLADALNDAEFFAESNLRQVHGKFTGYKNKINEAKSVFNFDSLDGKNIKDEELSVMKLSKLVDLVNSKGGKIDRDTGIIYTTSVDEFPTDHEAYESLSEEDKSELGSIRKDALRYDIETAFKNLEAAYNKEGKGKKPEKIEEGENVYYVLPSGVAYGRISKADPDTGEVKYEYLKRGIGDNKTVVSGKKGIATSYNMNNRENKGKNIKDVAESVRKDTQSRYDVEAAFKDLEAAYNKEWKSKKHKKPEKIEKGKDVYYTLPNGVSYGRISTTDPDTGEAKYEYVKRGKNNKTVASSRKGVDDVVGVSKSRSTEGNIDWTDTEKTRKAEKDQLEKYLSNGNSEKINKNILSALIDL